MVRCAYLADFCARDSTLAKEIPNRNSADLEDQLEAIHLAGQFEGRLLDIGLKFREARHNKEFNGVMAGTLWTIRLEKTASGQANAHETALDCLSESIGYVRQDQVLPNGKPQFSRSIVASQVGNSPHLTHPKPSNRDRYSDVVTILLRLFVNPKMPVQDRWVWRNTFFQGKENKREGELFPDLLHKFRNPPTIDEVFEPCL